MAPFIGEIFQASLLKDEGNGGIAVTCLLRALPTPLMFRVLSIYSGVRERQSNDPTYRTSSIPGGQSVTLR